MVENAADHTRQSAVSPRSGTLRLLAACAVLATCWGVVLPQLAELPLLRALIEHNEQRQIDPSAMFYTELEPMPHWRTLPHLRAPQGENRRSP